MAQAVRRRPDPYRAIFVTVLIGALTYSFACLGAAVKLKVEDLRPNGTGWQIHVHEKGGKERKMPCHHALAEKSPPVGIADDRKGRLFRTSPAHNATSGYIWQQAEYKCSYHYAYWPQAMIVQGVNGTIIDVDGMSDHGRCGNDVRMRRPGGGAAPFATLRKSSPPTGKR
jgi:hypothetical protein